MNYKNVYDILVTNAKNNESLRIQQKKQKLNYFERHHIIPKCMKGDNSKDNLVYLTAKEHFICHRLLVEIYPENKKLKYAIWAMMNQSSNTQHRYIASGLIYERVKKEISNLQSIKQLGRNKGKTYEEIYGTRNVKCGFKKGESRKFEQVPWNKGKKGLQTAWNKGLKLTEQQKNKFKGRKVSDETKKKMSDAKKGKPSWNKGIQGYTTKPMSQEVKDKISKSNKGKLFTTAHKKKISESKKGKPGRKMSEELKSILKQVHTGRKRNPITGIRIGYKCKLRFINREKLKCTDPVKLESLINKEIEINKLLIELNS